MSVLHKPDAILGHGIKKNIPIVCVTRHNLFVERGFQVRILGGLDVSVDLLYVNPVISTIPCIGHLLLLECEGRNKQKGSPAPGCAFHAPFVLSAHYLLALRVATTLSSHIGVSFLVRAPACTGRPPDQVVLTKLVPASLPASRMPSGHLRIHGAFTLASRHKFS